MSYAERKKDIFKLFEELSEKITEIYDVELAKEITEIYEDLALSTGELITRYEKGSARYWGLVKKLAKCEKERDEERRAKEQAEYDAEYYAKELVRYERMCFE